MESVFLKSAQVHIDESMCIGCGVCVEQCAGGPLYLENGKTKVDISRGFGCIACGHCMSVCAKGAITIEGRDLSVEDVLEMPPKENRADYENLHALMLSRRSIRNFLPKPVEQEIVEKILTAATTAPMSIPPSGVEVCVFNGCEKVAALAGELVPAMEAFAKWMSRIPTFLLKLFAGEEKTDVFQNFIIPLAKMYVEEQQKGNDGLFYKAPLAMYFYGTIYSDPADAVIAATYAMLAAESLGLGSCIIGAPAYIFQHNRKLQEKYHIPKKHLPGLMIVFGYPKPKFLHAVKRRFQNVSFHQ